MFEGLVRQLILGYLGQYIKDIKREHLKITLWNEEVLLENVELILEAFDYLQLPFALQTGNVGKLSIRIPWKKLGWDPIIIILEDVEICACQREDKEWTADTIERREFSAKKAKLAAAELAKLSRRVCDNQTGKSFISYITAKILDGIQVTIRNVHVQYRHMLKAPAVTLFGLKLSSLMIARQNATSVKLKGAQVNKLIEIKGVEFYCTGSQADHDLVMVDDGVRKRSNYQGSKKNEDKMHMNILAPLDMTVLLSVNRSGKLENDAPQYSVNFELSRLVISLDEIQLQQILTTYDYLSICQLREKYGRYRPWWSPLEKKLKGWQIAWWQYAQRSVLLEVRKRLRKTSYKYLGDLLNRRRKYVNLYKKKLKCLQEDQVIHDDVLRELEDMEKEAEIDDILFYRSAAEHELEDYFENSISVVGSSSSSSDKCLEDGHQSGKPRGWLNWLSRGMLGASGTDDSGHFSGVISDDVIQDIYEATKFHPTMSSNDDAAANAKIYLSLVKVTIREISATLRSIKLGYAIADLVLGDISVNCKVREDSAEVLASVKSAGLLNPLGKEAILFARKVGCEQNKPKVEQAFVKIQVDVSSYDSDISTVVKIGIQPLEVLCNLQFMKNLLNFFQILENLSFQQERILSSLNGITDTKARLLSKIEYVVSSRKRMIWDVRFFSILIIVPWKNSNSELHEVIVEAREICYLSKISVDSMYSDKQNNSHPWPKLTTSTSGDDLLSFQHQDLYDNFEIGISNFEVKMIIPQLNGALSLIDKSSASLALVSCIISDEPSLKGLDVNMKVSPLLFHFSPKIYEAMMGLFLHVNGLYCMLDPAASGNQPALGNIHSNGKSSRGGFWFSLAANLESVSFEVDLDSGKDSYTLMISLQILDIWFEKKELPDCSTSIKAIRIVAYQSNAGDEYLILSSVENPPNYESACQSKMAHENLSGNSVNTISLSDRCFILHYQERVNTDFICPECRVIVNNIDLHCYPLIVGQFIYFSNRILSFSSSFMGNQDGSSHNVLSAPGCQVQKLGKSDLRESCSSNEACILSENFPFATVRNIGSIYSLEGLLIHPIPDWRKQAGLVDWWPKNTPISSMMVRDSSSPYARQMLLASTADHLPHACYYSSSVKVELSISCMEVYFHDSSCTLAALSLPAANSLFSISDDPSDIFVSTVGMTLSSSCWASPVHDYLWGPVSSDLIPVLNLHVAKGIVGLEESALHLCFGIEHVSCTLFPDFLSAIIGYFGLPDWLFGTEQPISGEFDDINPGNKIDIVYNVEILGSNLFTPAHSDGSLCLKLDIPKFYCSFLENGTKDIAVKEIPSDVLVMADKIADQSNCLNLFGHDLSLLLLVQKSSEIGEVNGGQYLTLISQLSADMWVRIPSCVASPYPICIMAVVLSCQFLADECSVAGYNDLLNVINQFSIINEEIIFYTGNVLQFLEKKSLVENPTCSEVITPVISTEIRSCVKSMSVRLHPPVKDSTSSEVLAHAEMQFYCSASLENDDPQLLNISFSSLALFSLLNSNKLAEASFSCSGSPVLDITLVKLVSGENKIDVFLPSLQIWLHMYDWIQVIAAVNYYSEKLSKAPGAEHSTSCLELYPNDLPRVSTIDVSQDSHEIPTVSCSSTPENREQVTNLYLLDMEEAGITIHVPILLNPDAFSLFREYSVQSEITDNDLGIGSPGNRCGFVSFFIQTRCTELIIDHQTLKLKVNVEKASASVELYKDSNRKMRPLLQLSRVILEAHVDNYLMADMSIKLEIECDTLDGWITSHVIRLWSSMQFEIPEDDASYLAFSMLELVVKLGKVTILLTDGKWSPGGPLLEIVSRNLILSSNVTEEEIKGLVESDLQVDFNNIDKVMWEPFVEPWHLQLKVEQKHDKTALLNNARITDILVQSESQLNLNITEPLIEVLSRTMTMIEDSWGLMETCPSEGRGLSSHQLDKDRYARSSAPYVIQNLTSLPLIFSVYKGQLHSDVLDLSLLPSQDINTLEPGFSFPIYIDETPEEQLIRHFPSQSSDRLSDKHLLEAAHHYILIQLEGTSTPSGPISIDLVGHRYFEVNFSKSSSKSELQHRKDSAKRNGKVESEWEGSLDSDDGFVVPVVVDVSVQQYTKLIRLYSTVVLLNATSVPLEVRFDIPFGVSPKILDPVYPGQEFPYPLHLAEAGNIRCRPLGNTNLWSEAYSISSILSHGNRTSFLRPIVCYASHPSSDPFRCCILVNAKCLPSAGNLKKGFPVVNNLEKTGFTRNSDHVLPDSDTSKPRYIYWMTLSSPLVMKNYLPEAVSMMIENGSVTRHASLSEVETSFFHVDSSHDLTITFLVSGFRSSILKFPRAEIFSSMAKFDGAKYSVLETVMFDHEANSGRLYVTIEKIMDALSGAREVCISVPFLLYNCTGFPLVVSDSVNERKGNGFTIPSCYNLDEQDIYLGRRNGLAVLSSNQDLHSASAKEKATMASSKSRILERSNEVTSLGKPSSAFSSLLQPNLVTQELDSDEILISSSEEEYVASSQIGSIAESKEKRADAFMYAPEAECSPGEVMVRISRCLSGCVADDVVDGPWSDPFPLVPPTGSVNVLIPQPSSVQGHLVSVSAAASPFLGKTRIISFQHRYVISNACDKSFSYKQKGTGLMFHLEAGQHSSIEWTDTTRDLLVSVRFDEPGWQWSGCFLPDHLGDTQVKMRNFISGAVILIRIEVQSAHLTFKEEKNVGRPTGNSGTHLILVSIDDTGFMPYRIDNFSKERLRICQQKCESFETLVNSYTSCPYAWDEPCNPHRLTVEVPGERVVGSYALDDVKEFSPVYFPETLEKPERTLFIAVHSEGAIKVLSIIDSTYHIKNDVKSKLSGLKDKGNLTQKLEAYDHYKEKITINVSFIGISLMNSFAEELLFACAKGVAVELMQSLEQQQFSLQILYLQIDNQLHNTPYPVILSFNSENKGQPANQIKMIDDPLKSSSSASDKLCEPVFYLAIAKWKNKDIAVVSFECISLRVAYFHLDLEQDILLSLIDFARTISSRLQSRVVDNTESTLHPVYPNFRAVSGEYTLTRSNTDSSLRNGQYLNGTTNQDTENRSSLFALVVPIGAPWQQIHILARQQKKIYIEQLDLAPINFSLSFSSSPWILRNGVLASGESLIHRGIMALADIEGAQIHLKQLTLSHQLASWESVQEILVRHYTRQFIHEMYKLFGSAGVLGNPIGFARSVGLGIKDFLSVPVRGLFQSPAGLITGVAQGTTSLVSNTVYAVSDAATQFSKVAHKGIVAFTFDDQMVAKMDKQQKGTASQSKGLINGFFEGLTGLLQSPIRGAEKHGIPGVFSGVILGVTGLVARPAASILEVTGKTAQSIRNRSRSHHMASQLFRVRLPRALSSDSALRTYSWEEAIGTSILAEADEGMKLRDETLVMCKTLKQGGRYSVITCRLILVVSCSSLVDLGEATFRGIPAEPKWEIETDIQLDNVIHADCNGEVVHIVASRSDTFLRQNNHNLLKRIGGSSRGSQWHSSQTVLPLFHTNIEFVHKDEAEAFLAVLLSTMEKAKEGGGRTAHLLHQSQVRQSLHAYI